MEKRDKDTLNRMDINDETNCLFILKNNNENFMNNANSPSHQSAKKEPGRISKQYLIKATATYAKVQKHINGKTHFILLNGLKISAKKDYITSSSSV